MNAANVALFTTTHNIIYREFYLVFVTKITKPPIRAKISIKNVFLFKKKRAKHSFGNIYTKKQNQRRSSHNNEKTFKIKQILQYVLIFDNQIRKILTLCKLQSFI